jgi:TonB family protein
MRSFTVRTVAEYSVIYADYPWPIENTERLNTFLANVRDSGVRGMNARLIEDKEEPFEGHPGRVYKLEFGGGYILTSRTIVVKNRLYIVAATTYGKNAPAGAARLDDDDASKFLKSFTLSSGHNAEHQADNTQPVSAMIEVTADGEVSRLLKALREKNELVIGMCEEGAKCEPVAGAGKDGKAEVQNGKVIDKPLPAYPPVAKAARASGTVRIQIVVDETGRVIAAQTLSGHPLLQAASVKAARKTLFTPTLLNGKPVKVAGVITFDFKLQ